MQQVHQHIQTTLQDIYRKAVDADANLDALKKQQQGNFQSIFAKGSGFSTEAKRFLPYVEELSLEWNTLKDESEESLKASLPNFIAKLELILKTLIAFKQS
jgi:hypothetical protein